MARELPTASTTLLVLAVGIPAYQAAMPGPAESRMADPDNARNRALARSGELMGSAVLLSVGAAVSILTGAIDGIVLAMVTAGLLTMVHEILLRRPGFRMEGPIE